MLWSSFVKFQHQFETNRMLLWIKFGSNNSRDVSFKVGKPARKLSKKNKNSIIQERPVPQKYFTSRWLYIFKYPFIPTYKL